MVTEKTTTVKIAKDLPMELMKLARDIDFSKVPEHEHDAKIQEIIKIANKYKIKKRTTEIQSVMVDLPGCPQKLATVVSQMDFKPFSPFIRDIAVGFMRNYLKKQGLLR